MKKIVTLIALLSAVSSYAQTIYDIDFSDGSKKRVVMDYDDPNNLPRFNLTYNFFGFSVIGKGMLSYQVKPEFRLNDKMIITGNWTSAYTRGLDENIRYNASYQDLMKKTSILGLDFHYDALTSTKPQEKKTPVDYGGNTVYIAKLPRNTSRSLQVNVGFSRIVTPSELDLLNDSSVSSSLNYVAMNFQSINGKLGLAYHKRESYKVTADGISRSYFRYSRIYANLLYALSTSYKAYGTDYSNPSATPSTTEVSSGYVAPAINKIGWSVGLEKHMGIKNSTLSMMIGVEFGKIPHLTSANIQGETIAAAPDLLQIHFGLGFGTKLPRR